MTTVAEFQAMVSEITAAIAGKPVDAELEAFLNAHFPASGDKCLRLKQACADGVAAGWACHSGEGSRRFGRILQAGPATQGYSVDVVDITEFVGPHHRHPNGEIDLIMPVEGEATFDGRGASWLVYAPGSAHRPTVRGGRARILYLLPDGAIEFTGE